MLEDPVTLIIQSGSQNLMFMRSHDRIGVHITQYRILATHNAIQVLGAYPQTSLIMNYESRQLTDIILELVCF